MHRLPLHQPQRIVYVLLVSNAIVFTPNSYRYVGTSLPKVGSKRAAKTLALDTGDMHFSTGGSNYTVPLSRTCVGPILGKLECACFVVVAIACMQLPVQVSKSSERRKGYVSVRMWLYVPLEQGKGTP